MTRYGQQKSQPLPASDVTVRLKRGVEFCWVAGAFMRSVLGGVVIAALTALPALASEMTMWDPLESTCRHASLSIL